MSRFAFGIMSFVIGGWLVTTGSGQPGASLPRKTERKIVLKTVVESPVDTVYRRWTTVAGVESFFAEEAEIDLRVGGRYHIYFLPRKDPNSRANSNFGARILSLEHNRNIAFEWSAPPFAAHLNRPQLPLWVEVKLAPVEGVPGHTVVELANYGYHRSDDWDRVYEFFVTAWGEILYRLDRTAIDPNFVHSWTR